MATLSPSLKQLAKELAPGFPRKGSSDGWIGDQAHATRRSDHNPDDRGIVHAIDLDKDGLTKPMDVILHTVLRDTRTKYVIWQAKLYYPDGTVLQNQGHFEHIHISGRYGTRYEDDLSPWFDSHSEPSKPVIAEAVEEGDEDLNTRTYRKDSRVDLYVIGTDQGIYHRSSNDSGATWNPAGEDNYENLGGKAKSIISVSDNSVLIVGMDDGVWQNRFTNRWTGWVRLGGKVA